jgi:predicted RNA-binding Zn-ribbon protein involved in translation (DUF1610 family)
MPERQTTKPAGDTPKGKLEPSAFQVRPAGPAPSTQDDLHVCPECASHLVFPTDWAPAERRRWSVELRCPDCEWRGGGIYDQAIVDRFDEQLDVGTESLVEDLQLLSRSNMEEEIDRFADALQADAILPEDF